MAEVNAAASTAQAALFEKLGINAGPSETAGSSDQLGQEEFLKLMTAQLQNQDPFKPMDNGDFIAQMAQFSTVTGIREMGANMTGLADQLKEFRIATATTLLGHKVLVPGNLARADENGEINGALDLPSASSLTTLTFSDATTGEVVHSMDLGAQAQGLVGFSWTGLPADYASGAKRVRIQAMINAGKGAEELQPAVFADVLGTSVGSADGVMLDVRDYGEVNANNVLRFRA